MIRAVMHMHTRIVGRYDGNYWVELAAGFNSKENAEILLDELLERFKEY